ncbi:MAG: calcium-binding protein, partial [Cyanobacteriota bacterium]|nr:calcium-binding protein [Cyanobacteriota bacterium]
KQYYDDLDNTTAGIYDYAYIIGFEAEDIIQLAGSASLYRLNIVGSNTELYLDKSGSEPDELIGIFQGVTNLSLTSDNFIYIQPVNLSVSAATGTEAGTTVITVTATTLSPVLRNESVSLSVSGTVSSADYTLSNNTITIPSGSSAGTVTFTVVNDTLVEPTETATLTISNPSSGLALGSTSSRNITIINDDFPYINLSVSSNTGTEAGTSVITVTATASSPVLSNQTVNLAVTGTGVTSGDYTLSNSVINIPSGGTTGTRTFTIVNDTLVEGTETATISISSISSGLLLGSTTSQTVTITDNDFPRVNLSASANTGSEAGTTVITVTATATDPVIGDQSIDVAITGTGITLGDYNLSNSTINILNGQTTGTVTFTVADDALIEGPETATLTLTNPSSGLVLGSTTSQAITITDNDFAPPEDGNFDGIPDDQQDNIVAIQTPSSGYVTFAAPLGQSAVDVQTISNPDPVNTPPNVDFSLGFFDFTIPEITSGSSTTLTLFLPQGSAANSYWKYGPTPDNVNPHWYNFAFDALTNTGAVFQDINGDGQNEIILHFVDGQRGDDDLTANGQILDPGAPAFSNDTSTGPTITGSEGNDQLNGTPDNDTILGLGGNDRLDGKAGADTLIGGLGNDTYTVDNVGDVVTESANEGTDTVQASITYTLPNNVENLTLTGSANLNGTGNALNNKLTGNSGNNTLIGLAGNDTLDGKAGADTMIGGLGNDTYTVDNIGDVVVENPNEGADTVKASISYTLGANLENLTLSGSANINGTGNSLNNKLTGNTGANILNGGAGADTLSGKGGNDVFVFQFGQSTVTALDRISDFAIGADKIDLLTQSGAVMNAPVVFTRAADSATTNINTIVTNVFADTDGATAGNQALGINSAALVRANTSTYLIVNDGTAGFQSANDLVINLTGITGAFPALGTIPVGNFFV